jgi:hypothetical protein
MIDGEMDITQQQKSWRDFCRLTLWSCIGITALLIVLAATLVW